MVGHNKTENAFSLRPRYIGKAYPEINEIRIQYPIYTYINHVTDQLKFDLTLYVTPPGG